MTAAPSSDVCKLWVVSLLSLCPGHLRAVCCVLRVVFPAWTAEEQKLLTDFVMARIGGDKGTCLHHWATFATVVDTLPDIS